ncbi:MAG: hypothetical protein GY953_15925, partial [bacterium]|nr:hypothetical protein [bacterium]
DLLAAWSPDGNLLYFLSDRDGWNCIWSQRLEPATKEPTGEAFPVYHAHGARHPLGNRLELGHIGLSVARDKLVFAMDEVRGNIWMMEPGED